MANRDIVAIGTSAGGVEALIFLAKHLPEAFPASVIVTIHLAREGSCFDEVLDRAGPLPTSFAKDGEAVKKSRIYLAPPERHLLVDGDRLTLGRGPRENNARPAIDPMLRSVALCCGPRAIGVILTGALGDGASGLQAINQCGGITVVQDPNDARVSDMPLAALNRTVPQHVVTLANLPGLLNDLVHQPAGDAMPVPDNIRFEVAVAKGEPSEMSDLDRLGQRSVLTCPECNGVLWEIQEGDLVRYRCHVGHAYSAESMSANMDENVDRALGTALRALEERVALVERLRKQAEETGSNQIADHWACKKEEVEREAGIIREAVRRTGTAA